ncbi:MAG: protein kinase [Gemmatimonadaceae bacterium]
MARLSGPEWQVLEPHLDAVLELTPSERITYMASSFPDDPGLHARLEQLLVACRRGERLLLAPADSFAPLLRVPEVLGGRYHILRELGHGGMATVFLADDPKNRRQVAVKVLDVAISQTLGDERFVQEIEVVARLQHPHILPLFDSGDAQGLRYYVMPYVQGESLRQRLRRERQLPVDDALRIAGEVADALDFAHRHGVIHRDIKPENILLHEGRSMVADFGIALARTSGSGGGAGGDRLPESATIIGTPHYMSPEQMRGAANVTGSSDIYSLGVVLFEMLAGALPHAGDSDPELVEEISARPLPDIASLRRTVPPHVRSALARATERLPADRFRTANDFALALANPAFRHGALASATPSGWNGLTMMFASVAAVAITIAAITNLRPPAPLPVARFDLTPGRGNGMVQGLAGLEFTISRDGSQIVYVGESPSGGTQLWQRALNDIEALPIPGSEGALNPVLSFDGRTLAFNDGPAIRTLTLPGGSALRVVTTGGTPAWGPDGSLYYAFEGIIRRLAPTGGPPQPFTEASEGYQAFPEVLPDGRGLVFSVMKGPPDRTRIAVVGPEGGEVKELLTGTMARYASSGHLVWTSARGTLMATPFDLKRLALVGPSVPLLEGVRVKIGSASQFALSQSGALLYQTVDPRRKELVWVSRTGGTEPFDSSWSGDFSAPALSPDGGRLAVMMRGAQSSDLWIAPVARGPRSKLALAGQYNISPSWTPDGLSVSYGSDSAGTNSWTIRTRRVDGGSPESVGIRLVPAGTDPRWSPDGKWMVYRLGFLNADIMGIRPGIDSAPVPVVASEHGERNPAISPDSRWIAYTSSESGRDEVYVRPFPNTGSAKWVVSITGGIEPVWSHSGRELFYRNGQHEMVAAAIETKPTFSVTSRVVLFSDAGLLSSVLHPEYDVASDDQRFIMVRQRRGSATGTLILMLNLFDELRRTPRAPSR